MNQGANVRSTEALRDLRSALASFEDEAGAALSMAEADIVRTIDWIRSSQLPYWKKEVIRRQELLTRAKSDLARAQITNHAMGPKSTVDERKAIARAQRELEEAEAKVKNCRQWHRELDKQYTLYKGRIAAIQRMVASDLPNARHDLDRMSQTLDEYLAVAQQSDVSPAAPAPVPTSSPSAADAPSPRRVWKDLAPARRIRARAPLATDAHQALHAETASARFGLLDEGSTRQLAHLLGVPDALTIQLFDPHAAARALGPHADPPPAQDRFIIDTRWSPDAPTLLLRSAQSPLGESGWLLTRSDLDDPAEQVTALRIADAIAVYPELIIALAAPRRVALLVREGQLLAIHDQRGRPLSGFTPDILPQHDPD